MPGLTESPVAATAVVGGVRAPLFQMNKNSDLNQYSVVTYSQGYNAAQFNGSYTDLVGLKIEKSSLPGPIKQAQLRLKMQCGSTAVQLMPTPYWFNRLEIWQGADREIIRLYNDEMFYLPLMNSPQSKVRCVQRQLNLIPDSDNYYNSRTLAANATDYFYLPIPSTWIELFNPNLNYINSDLWLRLYPAATPINTDGNSSNTPTLLEIALVYQTALLSPNGLQQQVALYKEPQCFTILHPISVPVNSQTYNSSTTYTTTLEAIIGKCPLMLFSFKAGTSNTHSQVLQNLDLGDNTTVSVQTPGGQDILYNGSPARVQAIKWFAEDEFTNPTFVTDRNWYVISFGNNIGDALLGRINGFQSFNGDRFNFVINTGTTGTACAQTITLSAAPAAGTYQIAYRGSISAPLAYNASAAAMATAFNALTTALEHPKGPITASFSAALSAGTSSVVTLTGPNGNIVQCDDLVTIVHDSLAVTCTTAITQYAVSGFPANASYQLVMYAYVFASVMLDTNGNLRRVIL